MREILQPMFDKLQAKYRNMKYKEGKYFEFVHNQTHNGIIAIKLLDGPFKDIIYSIGTIDIGEDLGHLGAKATFDVDIIEGSQQVLNDAVFSKIAGDILLVILEEAITYQAEKFVKDNLDEENREDYIEEPLPRRTVRSENSTVPKKRISSGKTRKKSI